MATATAQTPFSKLNYSNSVASPRSSIHLHANRAILIASKRRREQQRGRRPAARIHCAAVGTATSEPETRRRSSYELLTLTTWLLKQEQAGDIDAELTIVLSSISMACKQIASLVQRAGISNLTGVQGAVNVQGEDQKKLDVVSNEVFSNCLRSSGRTGIIASEEEDVPVAVEESYSGNYIVVFDPLDGSSNIDAAVSTGSIFGIYSPNDECLTDIDDDSNLGKTEERCVVNVCQPGSNLLAAGYCKIYAFNEGNYMLWDEKLRKYMDHLKDPEPTGKPYSARYIGSLVGDFHRTLLYGGIYGYPRDKKSKNGKLRLLYECAPMSFIVEQAGDSSKGSTLHWKCRRSGEGREVFGMTSLIFLKMLL
ncbi:uncharacterized protein A4U43_C07F550 [Asparagus officinalis]|uniref:fructose-bisphosphatase n=1 Tax=Asparagus officinalis TaxID=4686 RepID=A0A5P1EBF8_ASPOF|nr:uncharacterized protein A4U43_C07F550 [Asparagus officinalis]